MLDLLPLRNQPMVRTWMTLFQQTQNQYNITLNNTYNMDETGIAKGVLGQSLVVVPQTTATQYMRQPGNKSWVSILGTISGNGEALPPFLVFKRAQHQASWYPQQASEG